MENARPHMENLPNRQYMGGVTELESGHETLALYPFFPERSAPYVTDLISIVQLSDSEASRCYRFSSFSKGTITCPYRLSGRGFDSEAGLYFNRARYYALEYRALPDRRSIRSRFQPFLSGGFSVLQTVERGAFAFTVSGSPQLLQTHPRFTHYAAPVGGGFRVPLTSSIAIRPAVTYYIGAERTTVSVGVVYRHK